MKRNSFIAYAVALLIGMGVFGVDGFKSSVSASEMTPVEENYAKWLIRVRALGILPDTDTDVSIGGTAVPTAGLDIDDRYVPELDITYFLTKNIALELVLAISKHDVEGTGILTGTDVGDFYIIPPHLMLQYHFDIGNGIKPYIGAGVNYSLIFSEGNAANFSGLKIDNGFGFSLQAGVDIQVKDNWYLNVDVKKTWLNVDAKTNLGATPIRADIDVDPWVVGVGLGYRF
jgi:outer membrane protein